MDIKEFNTLDEISNICLFKEGDVYVNLGKLSEKEIARLQDYIDGRTLIKNDSVDTITQEANEKWNKILALEEEIGVDLVTLIEAVKSGIWCYDHNTGELIHLSVELQTDHLNNLILYHPVFDGCSPSFNLNDHGITWAVDKKDLEQ